MLLLKLDPDAQHLQFPDCLQTLLGIAGETGDGLALHVGFSPSLWPGCHFQPV